MTTKFVTKLLTILFCGAALLGLAPSAQAQFQTLFDWNHTWRYDNNGLALDPSWKTSGYNDSGWAAGNGTFSTANEALLQGPRGTVLQTTTSGRFVTNFYFRTTFTINGPTNGIVLYATNQIDDGAVIYLNGTEVGRFRMPAGTPTANTFANRADELADWGLDVITINTGFVQGLNTLAVEVHQGNGTSSDMVWGMKLAQLNPEPPTITSQPVSQSGMPGSTVFFSVTATGTAPLSYWWRSNSVILPNARSTTYALANIQPHFAADYSVIVSNAWGRATSAVARLDVGCFTTPSFTNQPPDLEVNTGGTISISSPAVGTVPIRYQWYKNGQPILNAINSTYTKGNAQPADSALYTVVASNCMGMTTSAPVVVGVAQPAYTLVGLRNHSWRYNATGTDLGTAWRQPGYNDSAWPSGFGLHALETAGAVAPLISTPLPRLTPQGAYITTFYFRTTFNLTNDVESVSLIASNMFDDGLIAYLNGVEIYRMNMGSGPVSYTTLAPGTTDEGVFWRTNIQSSALVKGTNVLAVEVHQAGTDSSDVVFGMQINVAYPFPKALVITEQPPETLAVEETKTAVIPLGLTGEPAYYQWYKDGVAISGATANPLRIPAIQPSDAGSYHVVVTNVINSVTSAVVALTVYPDTNRPVLIDADGSLGNTNVIVRYSELVLPSTATNTSNYRITNTINGAQINITRAVLVDGTNVWLTTQPRGAGTNYILIVNNVQDTSAARNTIAPNSRMPISTLFRNVVSLTAPYNYYQPQYAFFDPEPDQGTAWKEFTFTIPAYWSGGNGGFLHTDTVYEVPYPVGVNLGQSELITSYYRTTFDTQVSPGGAQLLLRHFVDDGAVFYLNGTEVNRFNMRSGTVDYQTRPLSDIGQGSMTDPIELPAGIFRLGQNVLAAELHQFVVLDHDGAFAMQLDINARSLVTGPVVITGGPEDQFVMEGQPATFMVMQAGGATFQWRRNGVNIAGATNSLLTIPVVTNALHSNTFSVVVTSPSGSATSTNATLRVLPDIIRPTIVGAKMSNTTITVSFAEPVALPSATTLANYRVTNSLGQVRTVSSAQLVNGTNVTLQFASLPLARYVVVVNNVRDASVTGNTILSNSAVVVGYEAEIVSMGGDWKYHDTGVDQGTAWRSNGFNDSTWASGPALLGAKRGTLPGMPEPLRTTINLESDSGQIPTAYFRKTFNAIRSPLAEITFSTLIDDGAVIYLNGVELRRIGMSQTATIEYSTLASRTAGDVPELEGPFVVQVTNLVDGVNVIAVEVHQVNLTSSDIYWAGEFSLSTMSEVIPAPIPSTNTVCAPITYVAPTLNYERLTTNTVRFSWTNPITNAAPCNLRATYTLEGALSITNPPNNTVWVNLGTNSPTTITTTNSSRFFRLRRL